MRAPQHAPPREWGMGSSQMPHGPGGPLPGAPPAAAANWGGPPRGAALLEGGVTDEAKEVEGTRELRAAATEQH